MPSEGSPRPADGRSSPGRRGRATAPRRAASVPVVDLLGDGVEQRQDLGPRVRPGLDITFTTVLPGFAPQTGVGRPAVQAYAARFGQSVDEYLGGDPMLTPAQAGSALVDLVQTDVADLAGAYVLPGAGIKALP
jgi:hypothetical protein